MTLKAVNILKIALARAFGQQLPLLMPGTHAPSALPSVHIVLEGKPMQDSSGGLSP